MLLFLCHIFRKVFFVQLIQGLAPNSRWWTFTVSVVRRGQAPSLKVLLSYYIFWESCQIIDFSEFYWRWNLTFRQSTCYILNHCLLERDWAYFFIKLAQKDTFLSFHPKIWEPAQWVSVQVPVSHILCLWRHILLLCCYILVFYLCRFLY